MVEREVRDKCNVLFRQWANAYRNTPGLERVATLYKQLPTTNRKPHPQQSKVLRETEADVDRDSPPASPLPQARSPPRVVPAASSSRSPSSPVTLTHMRNQSSGSGGLFKSSKDKKKNKAFNLEKEKPQMVESIAQASIASTNLLNALKLINRESQRVSENSEAVNRFEICKLLRRQILRYIQLVESEQWIGSLLSANDELVKALMTFEIMDKSIEDDSDSDTEAYEASKAAFARQTSGARDVEQSFAGITLNDTAPSKPPRPTSIPMPPSIPSGSGKKPIESDDEPDDDDDEDNPFGDRNAVKTPYTEKDGMTW